MIPTLIVGLIFASIVGWSAYRSFKSIRNNSCPGCSGGCSEQTKKSCQQKVAVK